MSQKPASKTTARSRVPSGVPWWIWAVLCIIGGGIGFSLFQKSIPEDPAVLFAAAMKAAEDQNGQVIQENLQKLKDYPEFAAQQKLLEGMMLLSSSRPIKAIAPLQQAAEEKSIRGKALLYLGSAYAQAEDPKMAISTFESAIQDDENAHSARQNLATMLYELMAWEEASTQLSILVEKEHKPAQIRKLRGDIRYELRQYKEAAEDYEAAINADKTDPLNAVKAERLVQCLSHIGDFAKAEEFVGSLDRPGARDLLTAEKLLSEGNSTELLETLERVRRETSNDARASQIYAEAMLKQQSKDKAVEALVILRPVLSNLTRNRELYRLVAALARAAGEESYANFAQQNADLLDVSDQQYEETLAATIKTRDGYEVRLRLAEFAVQTGQLEVALKIYDSLLRFYPDKEAEITPLKMRLYAGLPPLVREEAAANAPGTEKKSETTDSQPATESSEVPEKTAPQSSDPPAAPEKLDASVEAKSDSPTAEK